jgi:hypothetical protein
MEEKPIYLAVLNITSWVGQCGDATHVYGHLILSHQKEVTIDNIEDWNVKYLGTSIELRRPLTLEIAKALDEKDGHNTYQRHYRMMQENPDLCKELDAKVGEENSYGFTDRFDTFQEVVDFAVAMWKELGINCPFISLYEGEKYKANKHNPYSTVILQYGDILPNEVKS